MEVANNSFVRGSYWVCDAEYIITNVIYGELIKQQNERYPTSNGSLIYVDKHINDRVSWTCFTDKATRSLKKKSCSFRVAARVIDNTAKILKACLIHSCGSNCAGSAQRRRQTLKVLENANDEVKTYRKCGKGGNYQVFSISDC